MTYKREGTCQHTAIVVSDKVQYKFFYDERPAKVGLPDLEHVLDRKSGKVEKWDAKLVPSGMTKPVEQLQNLQRLIEESKEMRYKKTNLQESKSPLGSLPTLSSLLDGSESDQENTQIKLFKLRKHTKLSDTKTLLGKRYKGIYLAPEKKKFRGQQRYVMLLAGEKLAFRAPANLKVTSKMVEGKGAGCILVPTREVSADRGKRVWEYTIEIDPSK